MGLGLNGGFMALFTYFNDPIIPQVIVLYNYLLEYHDKNEKIPLLFYDKNSNG